MLLRFVVVEAAWLWAEVVVFRGGPFARSPCMQWVDDWRPNALIRPVVSATGDAAIDSGNAGNT